MKPVAPHFSALSSAIETYLGRSAAYLAALHAGGYLGRPILKPQPQPPHAQRFRLSLRRFVASSLRRSVASSLRRFVASSLRRSSVASSLQPSPLCLCVFVFALRAN
ncbi:MAG: hypothetical protein L0Y44_06665 [Phycisphaerales bacterium]|nr:hypothetical protein [Phycisphaerales bacterium]